VTPSSSTQQHRYVLEFDPDRALGLIFGPD
jgi:hypothetical protein